MTTDPRLVSTPPRTAATTAGSTRSQTLDRGLNLLEIVAAAPHPLTIAEVSAESGLHRSIVYRLLRTLEDHRLVAREGDAYRPGFGLATLARGLTHDLHAAATRPLHRLADATDLAAFVTVREGDEAVTVLVVEPSSPGAMFIQRIGYRHDVRRGGPGRALRMLDPVDQGDDLPLCRARGWAASRDEVLESVGSVAAPIPGYRLPAAVSVTYVGERDSEALAASVLEARDAIVRGL